MAVVNLGLQGTGSSSTAGTTLAVVNTTGAAIPAGTFLHVVGCWDNIASVTAPVITCSSVGGATATANHATAAGSGVTTTAGTGVWHQCFRVVTTASITSGGTICTLTSDQSAVKRAAHAHGASDALGTLRSTVSFAGTPGGSPSASTAGTPLVAGDLVIGSVSFENSAQMTGDADTFNGSWSAIVGTFTTGGAAATNVGTGSQVKIVTASGSQTFNPTGGVADTIGCVYAVQAAPVAVTQASYRFYADGTETGSTALAAQDTVYTADLTAADVNLQLRTRLQLTTAVVADSTDDWQLQWEKNANGLWSPVSTANEALADGYDETNADNVAGPTGAGQVLGQSFLGDGKALTRAGFWMSKTATPTGTLTAVLYAHTGTYGAGGTPTGSPLATSTNNKAANTLQTTGQWEDWTFDGTFTLAAGTPYVIGLALDIAVAGGVISAGYDSSSATHPGQRVNFNPGTGTWGALSGDFIFRVFTTPSAVVAFNSASLTDAAATTNRLGAGTGSFVAGKVSEDGLVDNLGWTGNNYTELLYTVTLKQAGLANGDTLRFRVQRNASIVGLTYTAVPTIPVTKGGAAGKGFVVVGGAKKAIVNLWVVVGGVKKPVVGASVIVGGVKKPVV